MDPQSNDPSQSDKQDVLCMCFSPSEETLIASTSKNQLYGITMSLTEISKVRRPGSARFLLGECLPGARFHPVPSVSSFTPS